MRRLRLFHKMFGLMVLVFATLAVVAGGLYARSLERDLTAEYRSKGVAIAASIADGATELVLNRDLETIQATIDQYLDIQGVSYVAVQLADGELVAHTFVPSVPDVLRRPPEVTTGTRVEELALPGLGRTLHVVEPILGGSVGFVHVGMELRLVRASIRRGIAQMGTLLLGLFALSVGIAAFGMRRISGPLDRLTRHTRMLATRVSQGGEDAPTLDTELGEQALEAHDEVGELARAFSRMEGELRASIRRLRETTAAKERLEGELRIARDIQMRILPGTTLTANPAAPCDLHASVQPAREVGGDFYDFFLDDGHLCFSIGDVSGKGVPASLFMAVTATLLRSAARENHDPARALAAVNRELCRDNDSCMFVTVFLGRLDLASGRLRYCSGGHNPPYLISPSRGLEPVVRSGTLLGCFEEAFYESHDLLLRPGDDLFLYTDGVTEALDPAGNFFSEARLQTLLSELGAQAPLALTTAVIEAVGRFASGEPPADDVTVLALGYRPDARR